MNRSEIRDTFKEIISYYQTVNMTNDRRFTLLRQLISECDKETISYVAVLLKMNSIMSKFLTDEFVKQFICDTLHGFAGNNYYLNSLNSGKVSRAFFFFKECNAFYTNFKDATTTVLRQIVGRNTSITTDRFIEVCNLAELDDYKKWDKYILANYIVAASVEYEQNGFSKRNTSYFNPSVIHSLIEKNINGCSFYDAYCNDNVAINAILKVINFEYSSLSDSEKKDALDLINFIKNVPFKKGSIIPVRPYFKTDSNETMLSILPETDCLNLINKFISSEDNKKYIFYIDFVFAPIINRIMRKQEIDSTFISEIRNIVLKPYFESFFDKYVNASYYPSLIFEDNRAKLCFFSIYQKNSFYRYNTDNFGLNFIIPEEQVKAFNGFKFFKDKSIRDLFVSGMSFFPKHKNDSIAFIISDETENSFEENQANLRKYYFFSNKKKYLPSKYHYVGSSSNDVNEVGNYSYFIDEKNNFYSVSFLLQKGEFDFVRSVGLKKISILDKLLGENEDYVIEGTEKHNKFFNIVATCFLGKIIKAEKSVSKDVKDEIDNVSNSLNTYMESLKKIYSNISADTNEKNDVFLADIENLLNSLNSISNMYGKYIKEDSDVVDKIENTLENFWPIIESSIDKYSVCTSSISSNFYSREMSENLDQLALNINMLIKNLDNELKTILDSQKLFDVIDTTCELKAINSLLNKDSFMINPVEN